eukprot:scaffold3.g6266.t1
MLRRLSSLVSLRTFVPQTLSDLPGGVAALACAWQQQASRGVKKQASELRSGNVIELNGRLLQVLSFDKKAMGRQLGNVQLELRDIVTKAKHPLKLRPYDAVEVARLEGRKFQFLYAEGSVMHCMDPESFEQVSVDAEVFGDQAAFLSEARGRAPGCVRSAWSGLLLELNFYDGSPVTAELPAQVELVVEEVAPTMRGETAAPSYKPAVLAGGLKLKVPPFVGPGERVVVDTSSGEFVRRAS